MKPFDIKQKLEDYRATVIAHYLVVISPELNMAAQTELRNKEGLIRAEILDYVSSLERERDELKIELHEAHNKINY